MAIEYCHRGGHYADLDYYCEGVYLDNLEYCCWECLDEEEQEKLEQ